MTMLIRIYVLIVIVMVGISTVNNSKPTIRSYFIEKDFFSGLKLGEFSIFDSTKKQLLYRIESYYTIGGKIELIDVSSKQIIGQLTNPLNLLLYAGNFSIFNLSSNQWINGKIERIFHMVNDKYIIKWNKRSILMETKFGSLTTTFEYENHSGILAKFEKRPTLFIWSNKYDLQVLSDDLPHAIYFLAIAIKDHNSRVRYKG